MYAPIPYQRAREMYILLDKFIKNITFFSLPTFLRLLLIFFCWNIKSTQSKKLTCSHNVLSKLTESFFPSLSSSSLILLLTKLLLELQLYFLFLVKKGESYFSFSFCLKKASQLYKPTCIIIHPYPVIQKKILGYTFLCMFFFSFLTFFPQLI